MICGCIRREIVPGKVLLNIKSLELLRNYSQNNSQELSNIIGNINQLPSVFTGYDNSIIDVKDLPFDVVRRTKNYTTLHLLDKVVAKDFTALIMNQVMKNDTFVVEINPGIGLMTQELLEAGIPRVNAYEKYTEFMKWLNPLVGKYSGQLSIRPFNFLTIAKTDFIDGKTNSKNMDKIFEGIEVREWNGPPAITIIGAIPSMKFFYSLQWSLINQYLSDYGRAVLYGAILPSMSLAFEDEPKLKHFHRAKNVFLRTFFNYTKLESLPREAFFPWEPEKPWRKRHVEYYTRDKQVLDVVKIETKEDFFTENFTRHDAVIFYYFLAIHMRKRDTRIIPTFEKWIPGCGPRLIRQDYDIYTTFDELNSQQLLNLFKIFKSWPEYETSPFINFVETIIQNRVPEE